MDEPERTTLIKGGAAETRRHFDVVADAMKREVQVVAEEFLQLGARLDPYRRPVPAMS
jgi:hypothetical protein